jgi:hypothetical protein
MLGEVKKPRLLTIMMSCVLLTGSIFPAKLFGQTVTEEWVARYNGPANSWDEVCAVTVDSSGNVYVTGDSDGHSGLSDYATVKYDRDGNEVWVARYDGPANSWDHAEAIAGDSSGNVYVTGGSVGSGTRPDYATVKYDTNGNELWVARYANGWATSMAGDSSGNIYVTGESWGSSTLGDYATVKYDANGNQLWVAMYSGPGDQGDRACGIALDGSGNVYVTGYSYDTSTGRDYATVKYDTNGTELWVARYNGPANDNDQAEAITVDTSGNVYVTGWSTRSGTYWDYATVKYDSSGNELWSAKYNGPGDGQDQPCAIGLDSSGNVYVTGSAYSGTDHNYATIKYDRNGNELWVASYNGPGYHNDGALAMCVDSSGNAYVTGASTGSGTGMDYATVKYDTNGNQLWVVRYDGPESSQDGACAMALDSSGNVYVTGLSHGSGTDYDYVTVKYSQLVDPVQGLLELAQDVIELNLQNGIENELDAKLDTVLRALSDVNENNDRAATEALEAFIYAVRAQRGNKISDAEADALIAAAQEIIDILNGA